MAKRIKTLRERERDGDMPEPAEFKSEEEVVAAYESGYEGAIYDPEGAEECEAQEYGKFGDVAREFGLEDIGKGKISLLYPSVWKASGRDDHFHGYPSQPTGDCVSRGQCHAATASLGVAVCNGKGSWPKGIADAQYKKGLVMHPTPTYWGKRGGQSGWSCSSAAKRSKDEIGLVPAMSYPSNSNLGDLLLNYNVSVIRKYCHSGPPDDVVKTLNGHCTLNYSRIRSYEEIRDAIASGFGVNTCGGQGYSKTRDEWGVCRRQGHWAHSLAVIGVMEDAATIAKYREPLLLILNSWGGYVRGPRKVQGKDEYPEIPKGSFFVRASEFAGRDAYVIKSVAGWAPMKLEPPNLRELI